MKVNCEYNSQKKNLKYKHDGPKIKPLMEKIVLEPVVGSISHRRLKEILKLVLNIIRMP